jgi:hypothetical protein
MSQEYQPVDGKECCDFLQTSVHEEGEKEILKVGAL